MEIPRRDVYGVANNILHKMTTKYCSQINVILRPTKMPTMNERLIRDEKNDNLKPIIEVKSLDKPYLSP